MSRYVGREIEMDSAPELYVCFAVQVGFETKACYVDAEAPPSAAKCQTKEGGRGKGKWGWGRVS